MVKLATLLLRWLIYASYHENRSQTTTIDNARGVMSELCHVTVSNSNIPDGRLRDGGSRNSLFPLAVKDPQAPFSEPQMTVDFFFFFLLSCPCLDMIRRSACFTVECFRCGGARLSEELTGYSAEP